MDRTATAAKVLCIGLALAAFAVSAGAAPVVRERKAEGAERGSDEFLARRLLEKAVELHKGGQYDQSIKMLESIVDKWPKSSYRFRVWLQLGKHYMDQAQWASAIKVLQRMEQMKSIGQKLDGEEVDVYLEGLYMMGVTYYESSQYGQSFSVLRRIVSNYPFTVWANQSYYYIGMCHFAKENWSRAIENLAMVGTLVDPDSPDTEFMEAGRRFYVKVSDDDLPVLKSLGKEIKVKVETLHGDSETISLVPMTSRADKYIGSLPCEIGDPKPGDGKLQVWGPDEVTTTYVDENTQDGNLNVPRINKTKVVSTGGVLFMNATYDQRVETAYQEDNVYPTVFDADLDTGADAQRCRVRVVSRYSKQTDDEEAPDVVVAGVNVDKLKKDEKEKKTAEEKGDKVVYAIRDEVTMDLIESQRPDELTAREPAPAGGAKEGEAGAEAAPKAAPAKGSGNIHTGFFVGSVPIKPIDASKEGDRADNVLSAAEGDEIAVVYTDERWLGGQGPREVSAVVKVVGKMTKIPTIRESYVADAVKRAEKSLIEATAHLELGKIFRDMGLSDGAKLRCNDGLELVDQVIKEMTEIPVHLREQAFRLKWELALTKDDLDLALATCQVFARMFPESEFADQALMKIAVVNSERKNFAAAVKILGSILALPKSPAKPEAQFKIAQIIESQARAAAMNAPAGAKPPTAEDMDRAALGPSVPHYKQCAEAYPDSPYAGESLAKVVDYHVLSKDYAAAEDLLEKVYLDYPDAEFIPRMLLKWVVVASRRGNLLRAKEKCQELLFQHSETKEAKDAQKLLERIDKQLKATSGAAEGGEKVEKKAKAAAGDEGEPAPAKSVEKKAKSKAKSKKKTDEEGAE